jgi:hypothetical protein
MKQLKLMKSYIKPALVILLLLAITGMAIGCEDYGFPQPTAQPTTEPVSTSPTVATSDAALLAVHSRLLELAETHEAKIYLADFYAASDNWSVTGDYFKDGSGVWYVVEDMMRTPGPGARAYWQQASWFALRDGTVLPSRDFDANALRIEADLQELSLREE